jgi:hypothetical protein
VDLLAGGPQLVASCITLAAEAGLSTRTLFEARRRLPIECIDREPFSRGWWRLARRPRRPARGVATTPAAPLQGLRRADAGCALASPAQMRKAEISAHGQSNRKITPAR